MENPLDKIGKLNPPKRLLCGPGPSNAHPRVHAAMSLPQVGHMDPDFLKICDNVTSLLRYVWKTNNEFTIAVSGTGSAAWEAAVANLTFEGDVHLTCVNGYFGERHCDIASRYGADVKRIEKAWGEVFTFEEIEAAVNEYKPQILWICAAETSTGARQPLEGIGPLCHRNDCLFLVDSVTAIGGIPLYVDRLEIDACYAATQKCLSCPPGVAPLTLGARALKRLQKRVDECEKVGNWYLDMNLIRNYLFAPYGAPRAYHHTAPISMIYAFREALTLIAEEGIENVWQRHKDVSEFFWRLIEEAGLEMLVEKKYRLHSLHAVKVPKGIDAAQVIKVMREEFRIEIAGGLGSELLGKIWRIGLMGYNACPEVALTVVSALKEAMTRQGWKMWSSLLPAAAQSVVAISSASI